MDRFYFDLQLFATNITSGKSDNDVYEFKAGKDGVSDSEKSFTNVANYVKITGNTYSDDILSTGSHNVTVDASYGNDAILISATKYASINGGDGADSVDLFSSNYVTVEGGAGADVINVSDSDSVSVDGGDDSDTITISDGSKNVTVTTGAGDDTIKISSDSKNVVLTDLGNDDTIVLTDLTAEPRFATFNNGVLNLDGVKVTLSGNLDTDTTTAKIAFGDGTGETVALYELLKANPPLWNAKKNAKIATYSTASGQLMASLSGLTAFSTAYTNANDIPGITVDVNNNIILSGDVLNKTNVIVDSKDFKLALDGEEVEFSTPEKFGLAVTGKSGKVKTAKYTTKAKSDGYYVGDDGKKLKYVKANATATAFTIGNLATTTTTVAAGAADTMTGVTLDLKGPTGTVTISDEQIFADVTTTVKVNGVNTKVPHKKATIDGEDVKFIFTSGVDSLEVVGNKNDENIVSSGTNITLSTAAGNDWIYDYGSKNKLDLGAGNDYVFGNYSADTVLAGAGNDYIQVSGESNTVLGAAGNDTIEIAGGTNNTINGDAGNDFVFFTDTDSSVSETTILAGSGSDTISVVGGSSDTEGNKTYKFKKNEIDLGAGADVVSLEYVSDTMVISTGAKSATKNANAKDISLSNVVSSKVTLGDNNDVIKVGYASDTSVFALAGNDEITVEKSDYLTFDGGAGADEVLMSDSTVSNSTFLVGAGADSVSIIGGTGTGNFIDTGADNDFILISDTGITNSTISTGFSNAKDKVIKGDVVSIVGGDNYAGTTLYYGYGTGDDTIYGFTKNDKLVIAESDFDSSSTVHQLREVTFGSGDDTVKKVVMDLNVGSGATKGTITLVDFTTDTTTTQITKGEALDSQIVWSVSVSNFGKKDRAGNSTAATTATGTLNGTKVAVITGLATSGKDDEGTALTKAQVEAKVKAALSDNGDKIIIGKDALDSSTAVTKAVTLTTGAANGYKLALGEDVQSYTAISKGWTITDGENDTKTATCGGITQTAGYLPKDDLTITYQKVEKVTYPVVKGLSSTTTGNDVSLDGTTVILTKNALPTFSEATENAGITIETEGYTLAFADEVKISKAGKTSWEFSVDDTDENDDTLTMRASYNSAYTSEGYYLDNTSTTVGWRPETTSDTLLTVSGLKVGIKDTDLVVDNDKKTVTISKSALASKVADQTTIYLEDGTYEGYKLKLGSGITAAKLTDEGFKVSGTTAYYQTRKIAKNGYAVSEDGKSIDYYTDDDGDNNVFTLTGVKSKAATSSMTLSQETRDIDENGTGETVNVITLNKAALGTTDVTLEVNENYATDDEGNPITYALALAEDVDAPVYRSDKGWETVKGGLNYVTAKNTAGFSLNASSDTVVYTAASAGKAIVNITGLTGMTTDTSTVSINDDDIVILKTGKIVTPGKNKAGASIVGSTGYKKYQLDGEGDKIVYNKGIGLEIIGSSGKDSLFGGAYKDTLNGGAGDDYLSGDKGNDILSGGAGNDTLYGGNGNDYLIGDAGENILSGGNGNDTLMATAGTNKLTGGTGKDLFFHTGGDTTITDYAAGTDKIQVTSTAVTGAVVEGSNDIVFTFAEGNTITVKNGKNKWITLTTDGIKENTVKKRYTTANSYSGLIAEDVAEVWFDDENEIVSADSLSNITNSELVGEFENYDSDKLNKQENLVTYGG